MVFLGYIFKIKDNIDSSNSIGQMKVVANMIKNFKNVEQPKDERIMEELWNYYYKKLEKIKLLCL